MHLKTTKNHKVSIKMKVAVVWRKKLLAGGSFTICQRVTNFCTLPRTPFGTAAEIYTSLW